MVEGRERASFVGRGRELARLDEAFARALDGRGSTVLCDGEAGIGKTRLVTEYADVATHRGAAVLLGGCVELGTSGLPFGPFVEAFRTGLETGVLDRAAMRPTAARELARLLPSLADDTTDGEPADAPDDYAQARLFDAFYGTLSELAAQRPCLLILEDLHWGDASTYGLLGYLARSIGRHRLLVVGTQRTRGEVPGWPGANWYTELARRPGVERLQVSPFDLEETATYVASILGDEPDPRLVETIHARSDGNPFVVEELTAAARDGDATNIPPTLHEIILARLTSLSPDAQRIAGAAAAAGRTVDHDLLATLTGLAADDLGTGLRELVAHDILTAAGAQSDADFAFRHALTREVAYLDLLPSERQRLHEACADGLEARPEAAHDAVVAAMIAYHRDLSGDPRRTLVAMLRAAETANAVFAFADALGYLERAIDLWDRLPVDERPAGDRAALLEAAADAAGLSGDARHAAELTRLALEDLGSDRDRVRRGRLLDRLGDETMFSADPTRLAVTREATELLAGAPPSAEHVRALVNLGAELSLHGDRDAAVRALTEAVAIADRVGAKAPSIQAAGALGRVFLAGLRPAMPAGEIVELAYASVRANEAGGRPQDIAYAYMDLGSWLPMVGRTEESLAVTRRGMDAGTRYGFAAALGPLLTANASDSLVLLGRWAEAETLIEPLLVGDGTAAAYLRLSGLQIAIARGDAKAAAAILATIPTLGDDPGSVQIAPWFDWTRAQVAVMDEDVAALRRTAAVVFEAPVWHTISLWPWSGAIRSIVAGEVDAELGARVRRDRPAMANARACVDRALAEIDRRASELDAGIVLVHGFHAMARAEASRLEPSASPEAWADVRDRFAAMQLPYWTAYAGYREAEARLLARGADRRAAACALVEARDVADRIGAGGLARDIVALAKRGRIDLSDVPAPAVPGPETTPRDANGLTGREVEILSLLACGLTNRQIGERLFISPKTAGVHVSNILGKLGVGGRVEAATAAHRMGIVGDEGAASP